MPRHANAGSFKVKYSHYISHNQYKAPLCPHIVTSAKAKRCRDCDSIVRLKEGFSGFRKDGYGIYQRNGKQELTHRVIAEKVLGRKLNQDETVHHLNMIRNDNRHSNLLICSRSYHNWLHGQYAKKWAKLVFGMERVQYAR